MEHTISDDLRDLLIQGTVSTQEEICDALEAKGHEVNQSKISRLLRKVGAVKSKNESGQIVYRLPKEPAPPTPNTKLSSLIINTLSNETCVIVHTSPGSASMVARLLDHKREYCGILGTIAGDDTILIIPDSIEQTEDTLQRVKEVILG